MDKLDAINMMLQAVGSTPVNDADTKHPDVIKAKATLERNTRLAQKKRWWFNTDHNMTFYVDENGFINIPENVHTVVCENRAIVERGGRLYDSRNATYKFSEAQVAILTVKTLDWDALPEAMQEYIMYTAAAELVRDELEDDRKEDKLNLRAGMAMINVRQTDVLQRQDNIFNSPRVRQARRYLKNTTRFFGTPDA